MLLDDRNWLKKSVAGLPGQTVSDWPMHDATAVLNGEEPAFAKALDRSDFCWWHRNPDRKSYSVRLVRGEHCNFFHPDFVVCLEHHPGDETADPAGLETKENVKDGAQGAARAEFYGQGAVFDQGSRNGCAG